MDDYLKNPREIEERSFEIIRTLTDLSCFDKEAGQIAMRLVHTCGQPAIAEHLRISEGAIVSGVAALDQRGEILCDVEMVKHGLTKRFLDVEPQCFLNHPKVPALANARGESRTMSAIDFWEPHLTGSIAIIGNAPTALYRLMEKIEQERHKPALVIGIPVGFVGAAESKQYLWDHHQSMGIECITLLGESGGSALAAAVFNTLIRLQRGLRF